MCSAVPKGQRPAGHHPPTLCVWRLQANRLTANSWPITAGPADRPSGPFFAQNQKEIGSLRTTLFSTARAQKRSIFSFQWRAIRPSRLRHRAWHRACGVPDGVDQLRWSPANARQLCSAKRAPVHGNVADGLHCHSFRYAHTVLLPVADVLRLM